MAGTRSFRKSRNNRKSRKTRGGKLPTASRSRIATGRHPRLLHEFTPNASADWFEKFFAFIFMIMILSGMNSEGPKRTLTKGELFSASVPIHENPYNYVGIEKLSRHLPEPKRMEVMNIIHSPSIIKVSKNKIGNTSGSIIAAFDIPTGIPSKYTRQLDILAADLPWEEILRRLKLGPTATVKNLIDKVSKEAGEHEKEASEALLAVYNKYQRADLISRGRTPAEMNEKYEKEGRFQMPK